MKTLLKDIRELIFSARKAVVHSVDLIQVLTNFEIGRRIVEYEQAGARRLLGKEVNAPTLGFVFRYRTNI